MTKPVRLQLSRRKGFDLQRASRDLNGLLAVNCARPGKWGNPHKVCAGVNAELAVQRFREDFGAHPEYAGIKELRDKNLACYCALDSPCHADVLLELANK